MNRKIAFLLMIALLVPIASAGTAAAPEVEDDDNDASASTTCDPPGCVDSSGAPSKLGQAEIFHAWVSQRNETGVLVNPTTTPDILRFHVATAAAGDDDTKVDLAFLVNETEESRWFGNGSKAFSFSVTGTTPDANAPLNTTATRNGTVLEIDLWLEHMDVVGGDVINNITLTVTDTASSSAPLAGWSHTTTDTAPDTGFSTNLTIFRPAPTSALLLQVVGGSVTETINGTVEQNGFTGDLLALTPTEGDINATATIQLRVTNIGNEPDTGNVTFLDPAGVLANLPIEVQFGNASFDLVPGASTTFEATAVFNATQAGTHSIRFTAEGDRGGVAAASLRAQVPNEILVLPPGGTTPPPTTSAPPTGGEGDGQRTPVPAGLSFLSPMAEGLGLDKAFGDYAELVLLSLLVLLLILIVFLIVMLVRRGGLSISVEPRTIDVPPGGLAEFKVHVRNSKGEPVDAVASFEGDPTWETSVAFGGTELREHGIEAGLHLGSKDDESGTRTGTLRVKAPRGADDKESDRVTLHVAPLDANGLPKRGKTTQVRVRTVAGGDALPIRLAAVDHEPEAPEPGDVVETTARIENDSDDDTYHLRVVLNVDGEDLQEQPVSIPPRNARAVVFSWQVPAGSSKIRVRIFEE